MLSLGIISDTDARPEELPVHSVDVLISCGDISDSSILWYMERLSPRKIFAVKGNHDTVFPFDCPIIDLHLKTELVSGISFGGFSGSIRYKSGSNMWSQEEACSMLESFPYVDVFVSHNSPRFINERGDRAHIGFDALRQYIEQRSPQFLLHGHQHTNEWSRMEATRVIGTYGFRFGFVKENHLMKG